MRALILEDDDSFARLLEIRLKSWKPDLDLIRVSSIADAQQLLDQPHEPFDFAVLDQHLPDGRGLEVSTHIALNGVPILAVSSDESPELPGQTVLAGAQHFLGKRQVSTPLFLPLLEAIIERKRLEQEILQAQISETRLRTIRRLLATLRHEIYNPLGAVMGGTYLLKQGADLDAKQLEAVRLIESSSVRIKTVVEQLCDAADLQEVTKAAEEVFQVPGDAPWKKNSDDTK